MFNLTNADLTVAEVRKIKKQFQNAQANGSVMFKDIISFQTEALIAAGVYNPYTDKLNRQPLIDASRAMLKEMYRREHLEATAITVCEIHYNTNHFHIHYATVETKNTRRLMEIDGKRQPRGKRKESTLQAMKSTFANYLFDRSYELEQLAKLRDGLREAVKIRFDTKTPKADTLLVVLKSLLPPNKSLWNSKNLSTECQSIMNELIDELMKNNPEFNQYQRLAMQENDHRQLLYGQLATGKENQNSFYEGRMHGKPDGIYYRLSNSILAELRKNSQTQKRCRKPSSWRYAQS